jgi:hypothetical protein
MKLTLKQLGFLHQLLGAGKQSLVHDLEDNSLVEICDSIIAQVEIHIDKECAIFNEFQELTTQLDDLYIASKIIIKNPDAVTTDYVKKGE